MEMDEETSNEDAKPIMTGCVDVFEDIEYIKKIEDGVAVTNAPPDSGEDLVLLESSYSITSAVEEQELTLPLIPESGGNKESHGRQLLQRPSHSKTVETAVIYEPDRKYAQRRTKGSVEGYIKIVNRKYKEDITIGKNAFHFYSENNKLEKLLMSESPEREICMVVNYTFEKYGNLRRMNYQKDIDRIKEVIGKLENFQLEILMDLSIKALRNRIEEVISMVKRCQKRILIITMTHGENGDLMINEERLRLNDFLNLFEEIFGKPWLLKVFLFSYCLGDKIMLENEPYSDNVPQHDRYDNTFIGFSQSDGYKCMSGQDGDPYIQEFLRIMEELWSKESIIDAVQVQIECEMSLNDTSFCATVEICGKEKSRQSNKRRRNSESDDTLVQETLIHEPGTKYSRICLAGEDTDEEETIICENI